MKLDTLRGHLDALVLAVLEPGPLHGYAIISTLRTRSGGTLDLPTGTIYPALRRLERAEYVSSDWSIVGGRKRRTYELTAAGRRALASERDTWKAFSNIVGGVLGTD
ncbi:PadR family transcriptional regulator [Sphaerisporangium rufum]|uniref:PadR family transcriptional regulator n=1 Tax=Sphaerisporangium rufum TaxID=1381558 RepID=A0A919R7S0_9ACTN|nr:helix-turn-helix transcriptional regulator [Sphaerisporangium rufum]GII81019.1 PadR family transcriptional regulator [Sphaerisporangium rufum]